MPPDTTPPDARPHGAWQARAQVAEALAAILLARLTLAMIPLARWRGALGRRVEAADLPDPQSLNAEPLPANLTARRLARAVVRAAARLPGETSCLARALALHAMLHRRRIGATLSIGVRPRAERGSLDDLHAWVLRDGEILIGMSPDRYVPLIGFTTERAD